MKFIPGLVLLFVSLSAFAQDRVCLVNRGLFNANIMTDIFDARVGNFFESSQWNIVYGSKFCTERFYPELGDYINVKTSHYIFTNATRETCRPFSTNESVVIEVSGTTLDYYCTVKKCETKGCKEL